MKTILLLNGPNLNLLGSRQPEIYGRTTLPEIIALVEAKAKAAGIEVKSFQSNHEGGLIDFIQAEYQNAAGVIINPGALTHYGYALRDCLAGIDRPIIEVHLSNLDKREEWRRKSVIADICTGRISGLGPQGYLLALEHFIKPGI
jgi:3-dehydroquinate dehydratase II